MKRPSKLTIPILTTLLVFLVFCAAVTYRSEFKSFSLPIAGIACLIGILIMSLKMKAKEYAKIVSAPNKAQELLDSKQPYQLRVSLETKIMQFLGMGLFLYGLIFYSGLTLGWQILGGAVLLSLSIYMAVKFSKFPALEVNSNGVIYLDLVTIPWKHIAEISLFVRYIHTYRVIRIPIYFLQLNLYEAKNFKNKLKKTSKAHSLIAGNHSMRLNLFADEYNTSLAVEYTKAYAAKIKAPLIEQKIEQRDQLMDLLENPDSTADVVSTATQLNKVESEVVNYLEQELQANNNNGAPYLQ